MNRAVAVAVAVAISAALAGAVGCTGVATTLGGRPGPEAGLIRGKMPERAHGVTHVDRLTDGIAAVPDDSPRTDLTSVMAGPDAFVVYDLGRETTVGCAVVIADGDDRYTLALSSDGTSFTPLWTADSTADRGMQPRIGRPLRGAGRYLRLTAEGGDGAYAVSELAVADVCPARWPPALALQQGTPVVESATLKIWVFAGTAVAFIVGFRRRMPDFLKLLIAIPAGVAVALGVQLIELWPLPGAVARALLLALALVAAAAGGRVAVSRRFRRPRP